jgi:hypothetical protein
MRKLVICIFLCVTFAPISANAGLILGLCGGPHIATVTCDTSTGLEWLKLSESNGYSINEVLAGAGGFIDDGWSVAEGKQVDQLFLNAGLSVEGLGALIGSNRAADKSAVELLFATLGPTYEAPAIGIGSAISGADLSVLGSVSAPFFSGPVANLVVTSGSAYRGTNYELTGDFRAGGWGVYLVRTSVPEPSTLSLAAIGMLLLVVLRRRKFTHLRAPTCEAN